MEKAPAMRRQREREERGERKAREKEREEKEEKGKRARPESQRGKSIILCRSSPSTFLSSPFSLLLFLYVAAVVLLFLSFSRRLDARDARGRTVDWPTEWKQILARRRDRYARIDRARVTSFPRDFRRTGPEGRRTSREENRRIGEKRRGRRRAPKSDRSLKNPPTIAPTTSSRGFYFAPAFLRS